MLFKAVPVPENKDEIIQKAKEGWIKALNFIQSVAEKRGKKFIINDEVRGTRQSHTSDVI